MLRPPDQRFQCFGSFPDRLNLGAEHVNPRRSRLAASQVKGFADCMGCDQPVVELVHRFKELAHGVPPDALASLAAPAAAGMALAPSEAFALGFVPFVDRLFFGSGELSGF